MIVSHLIETALAVRAAINIILGSATVPVIPPKKNLRKEEHNKR